MSEFESFALSDIGVVRSNNEDYMLCAPEDKKWVLADGVGGHDAGEVASELACTTIMNALYKKVSPENAILTAHHTIIDGVDSGVGKAGMATTIVVMVADNETSHIYWVGDSRAYLIDKIGCSQLTVDHSLVQQLIETGSITPEEAAVHPSKNIVYQVLGMSPPTVPKVAYTQQPLEIDDIILLCSDGLSDVVTDEAIFVTINKYDNLEQAAEDLIQQAIKNGSKDNISILLVKKLSENDSDGNKILSTVKKAGNDVKGLVNKAISKAKNIS